VAVSLTVIESHHTTWVFDADRMRFTRLPKGADAHAPIPDSQWELYHGLELDPETGEFTVALNPARTQLLRSWRADATPASPELHRTAELHLDVIAAGRD
jgi:hypothetical protein